MSEQADAERGHAILTPSAGRVPRVVLRADLLPAFSAASLISLVGLPLGWIWAQLAPAQRMRVVTRDHQLVPLTAESWHRFDDLAIFLLLGLVAGLLVGVVVWLLRARRGPVMLVGAVLGSLLGAWLAMRMGLAFAEARFALPSTLRLGQVVERAPVLESGWVLLAQPLTTAFAYGTLAAWNARDDLGRRLG
ncbi:DUF2567 domain-containing protein [Saccharomonospora cyanea]|uniref:DUF2567 domain-containing protein n=1 Tax=Saccharomonospora cyanea NA-134 TaxID=882082 RepID=H5XCF4_9PSEU|nr:DUF2567 domain-containing protein [Saccharomonospora cyanea]EHR60169.1 Protein of unknown function (DUF2567) [Saccharomonospora cyanea NA-134]